MASRKLIARPPITASTFSRLDPNRFNKIHLYENLSSINSNTIQNNWKYELTILDRDISPSQSNNNSSILPCAVFLVPAGRESEYVFRTKNGLRNVAESANCVRLIAVSFNRNQIYINQEFVQQELERSVQLIAQRAEFWKRSADDGSNFQIPFLAVDGIGKRNVIAEGDTTTTGAFVVEEVKDPNAENDENCFVRRLYFLNNPNVIQSESFVIKDGIMEKFQKQRLAFDYHKHLSSGMIGLGFCDRKSDNSVGTQTNALVIGVGGGGLINFLNQVLPKTKIFALELDGNVVQIARAHFGFDDSVETIEVVLGDGLNICSTLEADISCPEGKISFPASSFDSIAIDVDSKDTSCGMSCPPISFVDISYLKQLKRLLSGNGVLAINVSARDPAMLTLVKKNVFEVFASVFVSANTSYEEDEDTKSDDLNVVIFAKKTEDYNLPSDTGEIEKMINLFCDMNDVDENSLKTQLEECLVGIKEIKKEDMESSVTEEEVTKKTKAVKKNSKKKGSSKKKRGNKK